MHILIDIRHLTSPQQSGVGEYTTQLLRALFEMDVHNTYVLLSSGRVKPNLSFLPLPHTRHEHIHLSIPNRLLNLRTIFLKHPALNQYVRQPIDLLFLPNLNFITLPTDIPTVLMVHDLSWYFFPEFYSKKMQLWHHLVRPSQLIRSARHIITPSHSTAQDITDVFHKEKTHITTIAHGVDPMFTPVMQARDHGVRSRLKLPKKFALFVGTIEPRKNLLALIDAVAHYRDHSHDDLHLVLAGKWGWRAHHIRHRLWKQDVSGWIHPIGYVASQDRPALYRSASVFTWPSIYEGFGLPVLEAMACGTPIITSRTSSLPELTQRTAVLIDPLNSVDISEALRGILNSSSLCSTLKKRGLERAKDFSWQKTAQETMEVFEGEREG